MAGSHAQAAYYYQNNVAALKIIECLFFNSDIIHIELEKDKDARHIDDIIVYRQDEIEYYQVKWSNDEKKAYTLYNLLMSGKKSLFKQLAEGYKKVKEKDKNFTIYLWTTKNQSDRKRPSEGIKHSLPEIRKNIFEPLKETNKLYNQLNNYSNYKDTLEKIKSECELNEAEFNDFIKRLEFKFSQKPKAEIQNQIKSGLKSQGIETEFLEKLLNEVVEWSISGEKIDRETVLKQLGIANRFIDRISHYFEVDDKYYVPNEDLLQKLENAITELPGGYIFVEGPPGIGKSTALTKFKESIREINTIYYYCYVLDDKNSFGELRHKSEYFLKSLCVSIEKQFAKDGLPINYSGNFEEKLTLYINKLGNLKKRVIFIIEGLDHVDRNTKLKENSLLYQINRNIPDGIYFILSAQYKSLLSSVVKNQIESDERRHITVSKFTQQQIQQYFTKKGIDCNGFLLDEIEKVSEGIPLYLRYISEQMLKRGKLNYIETLNEFPYLKDGEINYYHNYLYNQIEGNDVFSLWVLAVIAIRKENSTADTIHEILTLTGERKNITDVLNVINKFSHLLEQNAGQSYSIFHNSFREFILTKTQSFKDRFNKALVLFYEKNLNTEEAFRNYFKHLNDLGEYQKIIDSTTLDWMKNAWQNYRPLEEIKLNLDIAVNATMEIPSLSQYIRITFLRSQFNQLDKNFQDSEIDLPVLLLDGGEETISLSTIWEDDSIQVDKEYFFKYLIQYHQKTGNLLPQNILKQGFSKPIDEDNFFEDTATTIAKAKALFSKDEDIKDVFDEIDKNKYVKYDFYYNKEKVSDEGNARINRKIKFFLVNYLYECKKLKKLNLLLNAFKANKELFTKIQITIVKLLLLSDKTSAIKLIKEIDLSIVPDISYFVMISNCCEFLTNSEILQHFPKRDIPQPTLYEKVINKDEESYSIHYEIIKLFHILKPIWIYEPNKINQLKSKVLYLPRPAEHIYNSIFYLSELWYKNRSIDLEKDEKINLAKRSLKELYEPKVKKNRKVHEGILDYDSEPTIISYHIHLLFRSIFRYIVKDFSNEQVEELVSYWFTLEEGDSGYRNYEVALEIAYAIYKSKLQNLNEVIHKLIQHSEKLARKEEDARILLDYLAEIAKAYGICGFKNDFKRIYNQLIEIAFGLRYRKDYRASFIISPLELLDKTDPDHSLVRFAEALDAQNALRNVGDGLMHERCLSSLINVVAERFPGLAFILLDKEYENLSRGEAYEIVFEPLIRKSSKEDLHLLFSIVKTLTKRDQDTVQENFFLKLSLQLLKKAIELNHETFIEYLLADVKQKNTNEREYLEELKKFSQVLIDAEKDPSQYSMPNISIIETNIDKEEPNNKKYSDKNITELITLFERDYNEFEKAMQAYQQPSILQEIIFRIVEEVSIWQNDKYEDLLKFINDSAGGYTKSMALLKIGHRLKKSNPEEALKIFREVAKKEINYPELPLWYDSSKLFGFNVFETSIEIDKKFGKRFLLESNFSREKSEVLDMLDELLKYERHFENEQATKVFYESNLQFNKELAAGLPEKESDYSFILEHQENLSFAEITIKYLVQLFNFPIVKVRELTLQSVFDLVIENDEYLKIFVKNGLEQGNDNQIEYTLVVLQAISLEKPAMLLQFKSTLLNLEDKCHFNIIETLKELLLNLSDSNNTFLNKDKLDIISKWNSTKPTLTDSKNKHLKKGTSFIDSSFQKNLICRIQESDKDNIKMQDELFTDLLRKGLEEYNACKENAIHRKYNINTEYDLIEIQTPYYDEVKSSFNKIFHSKIKRGCFE